MLANTLFRSTPNILSLCSLGPKFGTLSLLGLAFPYIDSVYTLVFKRLLDSNAYLSLYVYIYMYKTILCMYVVYRQSHRYGHMTT